jgi:hypothetical protein
MSVIFKIIADSPDAEYLVLAVQLLEDSIKQSPRNMMDMRKKHSYPTLVSILSTKGRFFTRAVVEVLLGLCVSRLNSADETSTMITNVGAFQHIALDFNLWKHVLPVSLVCLAFDKLKSLITTSRHKVHNLAIMRHYNVVDKLLNAIQDPAAHEDVMRGVAQLFTEVLARSLTKADLGRVVDTTLASLDHSSKSTKTPRFNEKLIDLTAEHSKFDGLYHTQAQRIRSRNVLLETMRALIVLPVPVGQVRMSPPSPLATWIFICRSPPRPFLLLFLH